MAKLALKLKKKRLGKKWYGEDAKHLYHDEYYVDIYDKDTNRPVRSDYCDGLKYDFSVKIQTKEGISGLALYNVNGETKLIIEFQIDSYVYNKFPYAVKDGEVVNEIPLEKIIQYSRRIKFFNAKGFYICEENRFYNDVCGIKNFDVKFNENTFTIVDMAVPNNDDRCSVSKQIYDYNGKTIVDVTKEMRCEKVIEKNLNKDEEIIM